MIRIVMIDTGLSFLGGALLVGALTLWRPCQSARPRNRQAALVNAPDWPRAPLVIPPLICRSGHHSGADVAHEARGGRMVFPQRDRMGRSDAARTSDR